MTIPCPLAAELSRRIHLEREDLTHRWLERIAARLRIEAIDIFPSEELLDHVPILMDGIADYIVDPTDEIVADMPVIAKAMELGELRFAQGFDASEILKEYEILGGVLFAFCGRVAAEHAVECSPEELVACTHRLFRAISVIEQVTTARYMRVMAERVAEREERLRRFNRMITHELKNRVGATLGAGHLLQEEWLGDAERRRFAGMVAENAQAIQKMLDNLVALSTLDRERRERNIKLREAAAEVFRQLRELAKARNVRLRMGDIPDIQVNAAAVELCLSNLVSNAIKYAHPTADPKWVQIDAALERGDARAPNHLVVRVQDNGRGVPEKMRTLLFDRFFRAHAEDVSIEGTGLGLSLVQETAESLGGRAWAEFPESQGSVFAFSLPCVGDTAGGPLTRDGTEVTESGRGCQPDAAPATASGSQP